MDLRPAPCDFAQGDGFSLRFMHFFAFFAVKWFLLGFASLIASLRSEL